MWWAFPTRNMENRFLAVIVPERDSEITPEKSD